MPRKRKAGTRDEASAGLDALIEEATADAHDEHEQRVGFLTMIEEHLGVPFETEVLGSSVRVLRVEPGADGGIVVVCERGSHRLRVPILDLPLPAPLPAGAEWIEAYRRWTRGMV